MYFLIYKRLTNEQKKSNRKYYQEHEKVNTEKNKWPIHR